MNLSFKWYCLCICYLDLDLGSMFVYTYECTLAWGYRKSTQMGLWLYTLILLMWINWRCTHIRDTKLKRAHDKNVQKIVCKLSEKVHNTFYTMQQLQMLGPKVYNFINISVKFLALVYAFIPPPKKNNLKNIFSPLIMFK